MSLRADTCTSICLANRASAGEAKQSLNNNYPFIRGDCLPEARCAVVAAMQLLATTCMRRNY